MKKVLSALLVLLTVHAGFGFCANTAVLRDKPHEVVGWSVFGADDDIDQTAQLITELDTTYAQISAAEVVEVLSAGAGDTTQIVTVTGINTSGVRFSENISLNGTTVVTSTNTFKYVDQVTVSAACAGAVPVRKATGDTLIISIPIGALEATVVQHFNGTKDSYITNWTAGVTTTTGTVSFDLRYYPAAASSLTPTTGFYTIDNITLPAVLGSMQKWFPEPIKVPAGGWIAVFATGVSAADADGTVQVQGYDVN